MKKKALELMDQLDKKYIDSFFVHQCIIRRFKYYYRSDYDKLCIIRHDIESVLDLTNLKEIPSAPFELSSTEVTVEVSMASMYFFEKRKNRHLIMSETSENIRDIFCKYLSNSMVKYMYIKYHLTENNLDEIINILKRNIEFYEVLVSKYNIFNYYSLFSMTVYVEFDDFLEFYLKLRNNEKEVYLYAQHHNKDARWLYLLEREAYSNSNIYILIKTGCFNYYFYSPNISMINDYDDEIVINNTKSENSIYLKVSVDQVPISIDAAIQSYKNSIVHLLIRNSVRRGRIRNDGFENSEFMKSHKKGACLIK